MTISDIKKITFDKIAFDKRTLNYLCAKKNLVCNLEGVKKIFNALKITNMLFGLSFILIRAIFKRSTYTHFVWVYLCKCVCVCVCVRERESVSVSLCACVRVFICFMFGCVCARVCICVHRIRVQYYEHIT